MPLGGPLSRGSVTARNTIAPPCKSYTGGPSFFQGKRDVLMILPDPEGKRRSQAYFRSKAVKQVPEKIEIPDGYSSFHHPFPGARGLICCFQLRGLLLSCGDSSEPQKISEVHSQQSP